MDYPDPIACRLTAPDKAQRLAELRNDLFAKVISVSESDAGVTFSFANNDESLDLIQHFIAGERLCCPFLTFVLTIPPAPEPLALLMPGDTRITTFVRDTFVALIPEMPSV